MQLQPVPGPTRLVYNPENRLIFLDDITDADANRVGGKAVGLAHLIASGLPVPPGFVIPIDHALDEAGRSALRTAYQQLGGGAVAVRSSSTAEDGRETSFAGQGETLLGIVGEEALLAAVLACRESLHSERATAYQRQHAVTVEGQAMAVVVQRLVEAEVAGVLFTHDPNDPDEQLATVEASWGLGEAVVSGRVTPDRFHIDFATGAVRERIPGGKTIRITLSGEESVPLADQTRLCLSDNELSQLAELARSVEAVFGEPRDVEWARDVDGFHLLQARPITTVTAKERETVRRQVMANLKAKADRRGTVWVRYNLSEVLPEPTPMTWSVLQRLLRVDGGFGALNRDLGAKPDRSLGAETAYDLVAGRPMANLARLPRFLSADPPFAYPFEEYRSDPRLALDPQPKPQPLRNGWRSLLHLPLTIWNFQRMSSTTRRLAGTFADDFTSRIAPAFAHAAKQAYAQDWSRLDAPALLVELQTWIERTLVEFARDSLKPTVLADLCRQTLTTQVGPDVVAEIVAGAKAPHEVNLAVGLHDLASGRIEEIEFLQRFGHRGRNEMELAAPRWIEGNAPTMPCQPVVIEPRPMPKLNPESQLWADRLRCYLGLRESAKHHFLLGYAVIRKALVELDARFQLHGDLFYLHREELDELLHHQSMRSRIAERKRRLRMERSLEVPPVLFSDDLEAIGRPIPPREGATVWKGIAISTGSIEAPALVLREPTADLPAEPFILVCPSTDPAWVPIFAQAKGLVMETGGVLSHGAIVAREFGLPAVAGIPTATSEIRTGQRIRLNGTSGIVERPAD